MTDAKSSIPTAPDAEQLRLLRELGDDLAHGRIEEIVETGRNGELSAEDIRRLIDAYPGTISPIPAEAFACSEYYPTDTPDMASADLDLWYDGELSDLTLLADFVRKDGRWSIRIADIHVL